MDDKSLKIEVVRCKWLTSCLEVTLPLKKRQDSMLWQPIKLDMVNSTEYYGTVPLAFRPDPFPTYGTFSIHRLVTLAHACLCILFCCPSDWIIGFGRAWDGVRPHSRWRIRQPSCMSIKSLVMIGLLSSQSGRMLLRVFFALFSNGRSSEHRRWRRGYSGSCSANIKHFDPIHQDG